jgi:predicted dehydrogenase
MDSNRRLRVAIVGFGRMGAVHAAAVRGCPEAHLAAAADPHEDARRRASELGVPVFARLEQMLEEVQPHAVVVCTPPCYHADVTAHCLRRGIHVLCEKPLTTDPTSARQLWRLAAEGGCTMLVATKFRHLAEV